MEPYDYANASLLIDQLKGMNEEVYARERTEFPPILMLEAGPQGSMSIDSIVGMVSDTSDTTATKIITNLSDRLIYPVITTGRHDFSYMITIGRASNNDIILPSLQVSKFHCYITENGGYELTNNSDQGTMVKHPGWTKAERLDVSERKKLVDRSELTIGPYQTVFLESLDSFAE